MNKKDKRRYLINIIVIIIMAFLGFFYLTKSDIIKLESINEIKLGNYFVVIICYLFAIILISLVDFITYRSITKSLTFPKAIMNTLSGQLGSSITPFRSAHFPLMIYYQHEAGIKTEDTIVGLVKSQIIYSLSSIIVYTIIVLVLLFNGLSIEFYGNTVKLWYVILLGLAFHLVAFTIIVILAFIKPLQAKILYIAAIVLKKFKKSLDVSKFIEEKSKKLEIYREQISIIKNNPINSIGPMLIYVLHMIVNGSICYIAFILISSSSFDINNLFKFYILYLATNYITNIIPLPGGAGTTEVVFSLVFINLMSSELLSKTLVLFRISTYYIFIVIDIFIFAIISLINSYKRSKK